MPIQEGTGETEKAKAHGYLLHCCLAQNLYASEQNDHHPKFSFGDCPRFPSDSGPTFPGAPGAFYRMSLHCRKKYIAIAMQGKLMIRTIRSSVV